MTALTLETSDKRVRGGISVEILADSITDGGSRLVTWLWKYPRFIHAEIMTHRALSRNAASSRAIPAKKLRERVLAAPAEPLHWGQNQAGMQANEELADPEAARRLWFSAMRAATLHHEQGEEIKLHKQIVNRLIEPWMTIEVIVSATDHANLFHLRKHRMAEPNFQALAELAWEAFHDHMPEYIAPGGWHLPYIDAHDLETATSTEQLRAISVGRCARVSLLTHDGRRDHADDIGLHDRLAATAYDGDPMHASPFEHVAQAVGKRERVGNFEGWIQYRKMFANENGPDTHERCERCGCWGGNHVLSCPNR